MRTIPVQSSGAKAIGYDLEARVLRVDFQTGTYEYEGVPPEVVTQVLFAESIGKALGTLVKGRGYAFRKIEVTTGA